MNFLFMCRRKVKHLWIKETLDLAPTILVRSDRFEKTTDIVMFYGVTKSHRKEFVWNFRWRSRTRIHFVLMMIVVRQTVFCRVWRAFQSHSIFPSSSVKIECQIVSSPTRILMHAYARKLARSTKCIMSNVAVHDDTGELWTNAVDRISMSVCQLSLCMNFRTDLSGVFVFPALDWAMS